MSQAVNLVALVKGTDHYFFLFKEKNRSEAFRTFARFATNKELNFTWYDAAVLSQKLRQENTSEKINLNSLDF